MARKAGMFRPIIATARLRKMLEEGATLSEIAREHNVRRTGLVQRVKRMQGRDAVVAVAHPPHQAETTRQQMHARDYYLKQVALLQEMLDAYQLQFRDEQGNLHMHPSAAQHSVRYPVEVPRKDGSTRTIWRVETMQSILSRMSDELGIVPEEITVKGADPRVEMRHLADTLAAKAIGVLEIGNLLHSTQEIQAWMAALQAALNRVSPEVGKQIARAMAHQLIILLPDPAQRTTETGEQST